MPSSGGILVNRFVTFTTLTPRWRQCRIIREQDVAESPPNAIETMTAVHGWQGRCSTV